MIVAHRPLRFGHHAMAALGASMLGATIFAIVWTTALGMAMGERLPGAAWLIMMAAIAWLGVLLVAVPTTGLLFSLLWPATRRRTVIGNAICLAAGALLGALVSPLASAKLHGASEAQVVLFTLIGAALAAIYLVFLNRLARDAA